ncbi:bifunctional ADP-dependent NAD(P)H-hydrate dehydratase/NAD(P)H-hydrate epimerase [Lutibaculum baratangense]|uniref:Bifunctional NAD(P)H-hydrate repair enzyme n=1 Tax=Lutibaculum baratangense AMV1 TaxID=631454 RepID=V4TG53_9HYPH|nr:bifunctional ADP-dependent NAD(P)H-hydrate dehydratase/NAD(P)H-hydrate epimerase [Lutibaculum baratangense]ESR25103.1 NAD(P)HX epimerase [Lutibaculum baratangense AMV1]
MIELLTTQEMGQADRLAIEGGTSGLQLMEAAGGAVAERAMRRTAPGDRVAILCGPGNNGGDGFVAARRLVEAGRQVRLALLGSREGLRGDAATVAGLWEGPVERFSVDMLDGVGLVVDALFGAGLARPLDGEAASIVAAVNEAGRPVLAVDVPSGLDGTTGRAQGPVVRATETITFFRRKPGHLLLPGRSLCGEVSVAEIGISQGVLGAILPQAFVNEPALWRSALAWPQPDGHKYSRGHALVVGGEGWKSGAPRLAAGAALRAGAGLVTIAAPFRALPIYASQLTAVMLAEANNPDGLGDVLADERKNAVLLGPGLGVGAGTAAMVKVALCGRRAIVLDADALTSFEARREDLFAMIAAEAGRDVVLTPHEGEFARLFGKETLTEAPSKLEAARAAARASGAIVVLKGSDTVVAGPDGRAAVNEMSSPFLATAGTGDVLAGIIVGQLAQGVAGFEAAASAVWIHGAAAARRGPGLISEDLQALMPGVLAGLAAGV